MPKQKKTYRELAAELDDILQQLNDSDADVDAALKLYERGVEVSRELTTYLQEAENKLSELQEAGE